MGTGASRREPEVHVVVVQSQENGKMEAKVLRRSYPTSVRREGERERKDSQEDYQESEPEDPSEHHTHQTAETHTSSSSHPHQHKHHQHHSNSTSAPMTRTQPVRLRREPPIPKRLSLPTDVSSNTPTTTGVRMTNNRSTNMTPDFTTYTAHLGTPLESYSPMKTRSSPLLGRTQLKPQTLAGSSLQNPTRSTHFNLTNHSTATMETMPEATVSMKRLGGGSLKPATDLSPVSEKGEGGGNMFELFRTHDGEEEYTVYVREDGKKFYVDWEEQKWRYFPASWNERGYFLPIDYDPYSDSHQGTELGNFHGKDKSLADGRAGEFIHPTRGKLLTYLRQETMNVIYFFDTGSGAWLPMPLSWERHVPSVSGKISEIQRSCPAWRNCRSIVATLRQCNYSTEDCITAYNSINDDGVLDYSDGTSKDILRTQMEKKVMETTSALNEYKERNRELRNQMELLQNRIEELEVEGEEMKEELAIGKEQQRRQSKVYRQQSYGYSSRLVDPAALQPLLLLLGEDARTLRAKLLALRNTTVKGLKGCSTMLQQLSSTLPQLLRSHRRQNHEIHEVRALYMKETLRRKLLYNEIQELRGNIRVFCRCRYDSNGPCALQFDGGERVSCITPQGRRKVFEFEKIYTPETTQEEVFEDTKPIITSCVDGYNICIIAYGQTGAGKTYTMMGPSKKPGVNIRSMKELFKICSQRTKVKYTMKVSIVEVYNESVYDLLIPPSEGHAKLQLHKRGKEVIVPGLTEVEVASIDDVLMVMQEGENNRTVASTKMNTNSSRSHLLFLLKVEGYDTVSRATSHGRLTLVDLAGSERISRSEATGIRLVEAAAINKSLSALGQVFVSIHNGALHIPYRNSKLTHLLQPCLGGDSKACMFVNISPLEANIPETVSTLEFGQNARQVELGKAVKHVTKPTNILSQY